MTNEEIRLNQYCKHCRNYDKGCSWLCRGRICNEADAYETALDEKDHQFKEYLEIKRKNILAVGDEPRALREEIAVLDEIINELFGETEQDNSDREE